MTRRNVSTRNKTLFYLLIIALLRVLRWTPIFILKVLKRFGFYSYYHNLLLRTKFLKIERVLLNAVITCFGRKIIILSLLFTAFKLDNRQDANKSNQQRHKTLARWLRLQNNFGNPSVWPSPKIQVCLFKKLDPQPRGTASLDIQTTLKSPTQTHLHPLFFDTLLSFWIWWKTLPCV